MGHATLGEDKVEERGQEAMEGDGASSNEEGMGQGIGAKQGVRQRLNRAGGMGEGEPCLLLVMFGHTSIGLC